MKIQSKTTKFLLSAMVLLLVILTLSPAHVEAAGKVKFNPSKKTIYVGDSCALKLVNNNKKVKWSVSNKNIKIISKNNKQVKIKGVKKGTAYVNAKVGSKTYKCKVTVNAKGKKKSIQGIEYELQDTGKGVVAILKNKNKYTASVSAKIAYYRNGKMIGTASDENYAFEKGRSCALFFNPPYNSSYQNVDYDDFKLSLSVEKGTNLICAAGKIKVSSNFGEDNVSATVKNNSGKKLSFIIVSCIFYDSKGNAIGYSYHYAECKKKGSTDYLSFEFPSDDNYDTIRPAKYKIYVNGAYTYTWMK